MAPTDHAYRFWDSVGPYTAEALVGAHHRGRDHGSQLAKKKSYQTWKMEVGAERELGWA